MEILDATQVPQGELKYAGFWIRAAALIIDMVVVLVPYFLTGSLMIYIFFVQDMTYSDLAFTISRTFMIGSLIAVILYFVLMESSSQQATFGKRIVGIQVGKSNGERISFINAVIRFLSRGISVITLFIGYIMVASDGKKQALHDKFADTYVYYK